MAPEKSSRRHDVTIILLLKSVFLFTVINTGTMSGAIFADIRVLTYRSYGEVQCMLDSSRRPSIFFSDTPDLVLSQISVCVCVCVHTVCSKQDATVTYTFKLLEQRLQANN